MCFNILLVITMVSLIFRFAYVDFLCSVLNVVFSPVQSNTLKEIDLRNDRLCAYWDLKLLITHLVGCF